MPRILIIEDEPDLVRVLRSYLENASYTVSSASRGDTGLAAWEAEHPDLVLLDLNLPKIDGLEVARSIRRKDNTPIIILTARVEEIDRLIGLELGADDYITKPFSPREVVARVRAVLRRATPSTTEGTFIRVGDLELDSEAHIVRRGGAALELTPSEYNLLWTMIQHPGRVYSRLQLLEAVQGSAYEGYERTIDAHIKNLRAKLEPDPKKPRYIETIFGVGYRLNKED